MELVHLKSVLAALTFVGVIPYTSKTEKHKWLNTAHRIYTWIVYTFFYCNYISGLIELYQIWSFEKLDEVTNNLTIAILYLMSSFQSYLTRSKNCRKLLEKISKAEEETLENEDVPQEIKNIYMETVEFSNNLYKSIVFVAIVAMSVFWTTPMLQEYWLGGTEPVRVVNGTEIFPKRPLPFSTWFPFDRFKYYKTAYIMQILYGLIGCTNVTLDTVLFGGLMLFASGQLRILQLLLRRLKPVDSEFGNRLIDLVQRKMLEDAFMRKKMTYFVRYHRFIISFVEDLNNLLKNFFFTEFAMSSLHLGLICFEIVVVGLSAQLLIALAFLWSMLIQAFVFYWFAHEIMSQSLGIADAVWESNWYICNTETKRTLHFILMRSQKPLVLTVGNLYTMSLNTGLVVLKGAYTFVTILRLIY